MAQDLQSFRRDWQRWSPAERLAVKGVVLALASVTLGHWISLIA